MCKKRVSMKIKIDQRCFKTKEPLGYNREFSIDKVNVPTNNPDGLIETFYQGSFVATLRLPDIFFDTIEQYEAG